MNSFRAASIVACALFLLALAPFRNTAEAQYGTPTPTGNPSIDCVCLSNGNCSDPAPNQGKDCSTGQVLACGVQCPPGYRNVEMKCGDTSCGGKCVYEQTCVTGYCQSNPSANPPITCNTDDASFLCGDGGCNACQRLTNITTCNGSVCQYWCSADSTCGTGCGGWDAGRFERNKTCSGIIFINENSALF